MSSSSSNSNNDSNDNNNHPDHDADMLLKEKLGAHVAMGTVLEKEDPLDVVIADRDDADDAEHQDQHRQSLSSTSTSYYSTRHMSSHQQGLARDIASRGGTSNFAGSVLALVVGTYDHDAVQRYHDDNNEDEEDVSTYSTRAEDQERSGSNSIGSRHRSLRMDGSIVGASTTASTEFSEMAISTTSATLTEDPVYNVTTVTETHAETIATSIISAYRVQDENDQSEQLQALQRQAIELQKERDNAPRAEVIEVDVQGTKFPSSSSLTTCAAWCKFISILLLLTLILLSVLVVLLTSNKEPETGIATTSNQEEGPIKTSLSPLSLPPTLQTIKQRGKIICSEDPVRSPLVDHPGPDMCAALAAALFDGDSTKHELKWISFQDQFYALANGTIDISVAATQPTMERDILEVKSQLGVSFTNVAYYTGTTFAGIPEYVDCADRGDTLMGICSDVVVCAVRGSVHSDFARRHLPGSPIYYVDGIEDSFGNLKRGDCNVLAAIAEAMTTELARYKGYDGPYGFSTRIYRRNNPVMTIRDHDSEFLDFVNWIFRSFLVAERMNITHETAYSFPTSQATLELFGNEYPNMFQHAISVMGNYEQMYDKYWASLSPRNRTKVNELHVHAADGGLLYPIELGSLDRSLRSMKESFEPHEALTSTKRYADAIEGKTVTFKEIEDRQVLHCGIVVDYDGGQQPQHRGLVRWNETIQDWMGIHVDYCRGIAAAMFTENHVTGHLILHPYISLQDAFVGLDQLDIDVIAGAIYNMENDVREPTTGKGFAFSDVYYYHSIIDSEGREEVVLPLALATRQDVADVQWAEFVKLITTCIIHAEDVNITQATAVQMPLLELTFGQSYRQALRHLILSIGNYAEIYERNMESYLPRMQNQRNKLNRGSSPMHYANWIY